MKIILGSVIFAVCILGIGYYFGYQNGWGPREMPNVDENGYEEDSPSDLEMGTVDFDSCVAAGNPVMESYPEQCRSKNGQVFVRGIGNELEKMDLIRITSPRPNDTVVSPLTITGVARGYWFFEASFPVTLTNWDGLIIAEGYATADGEWMTEDFVPFTATLKFESPYSAGSPDFMRRGTLILQKDNPSGLPENDDALEIPVRF